MESDKITKCQGCDTTTQEIMEIQHHHATTDIHPLYFFKLQCKFAR